VVLIDESASALDPIATSKVENPDDQRVEGVLIRNRPRNSGS